MTIEDVMPTAAQERLMLAYFKALARAGELNPATIAYTFAVARNT